jgi:hypothetical protein
VVRWREIVARHLPDAPVGGEQWGIVWRHAAGGTTTGLDADGALGVLTMEVGYGATRSAMILK